MYKFSKNNKLRKIQGLYQRLTGCSLKLYVTIVPLSLIEIS